MMRARMAGLLSLTVAAIWASASAVSAAPYAGAADAYLAANKGCAAQFEKMKLEVRGEHVAFQTFDGVEAFPGFVVAKADQLPPGLSRFRSNGLFAVGKAELAADATGSVYVVVGTGNRGKAQCSVVAFDAPGGQQATLDWLAAPDSGFKDMKLDGAEASYAIKTFGHPLVDNLGTRIDLYFASEGYIDSITSFAAFTVGQMTRQAPTEPDVKK